MFKNKMLLLVTLFVGISVFAAVPDDSEPELTLVQRMKAKGRQAFRSPIVPIAATALAATVIDPYIIKLGFKFDKNGKPDIASKATYLNPLYAIIKISAFIPKVGVSIAGRLIDNTHRINKLLFAALPAYALTRLIPGQNELTKTASAVVGTVTAVMQS